MARPLGLRPFRRRRWRLLVVPVLAVSSAAATGACGSSGPPLATGTTRTSGTTPVTGTTLGAGSPTASGAAAGTPVPAELNPPGDIPDTVAYVTWVGSDRRLRFAHPEGWSQVAVPGGVRFSDKLNSVTVTVAPGPVPSVAAARARVAPTLGGPGRATRIIGISAAALPAGPAVRIVWQVNSLPNPVTGRSYRDEVVTYLVGQAGRVVRMDLSGTVGSDNVDPYRRMSESLALS